MGVKSSENWRFLEWGFGKKGGNWELFDGEKWIFEKFFRENCILSHIFIAAYLKVLNFAFIISVLSIETRGSI